MKRMIACVLADPPASYLGTTNHRHNKTRIAVGKAAGFDLDHIIADAGHSVCERWKDCWQRRVPVNNPQRGSDVTEA